MFKDMRKILAVEELLGFNSIQCNRVLEVPIRTKEPT
jgi:hypothetical protein